MRKIRKAMAVVLTLAMVVVGFQMLPQTGVKTKATSTTVGLVRNPRLYSGNITVWDCIYFGNYWQSSDGNGGYNYEPIKWRVLSVNGNEAFVIADQCLDAHQFHSDQSISTANEWSLSELRTWLNGTYMDGGLSDSFYDNAFNVTEKNAIFETEIKTFANNSTTDYTTTTDKVFVLSKEELCDTSYGFPSDENMDTTNRRCAKRTTYAIDNGVSGDSNSNESSLFYGNGNWWTRSPSDFRNNYASMNVTILIGQITTTSVANEDIGARPALHVDLSSKSVRYAGVVQSSGAEQETATEEPVTFSGNIIKINGTTVDDIEMGETYTCPTGGGYYCEFGYIDADNPENIYKPGAEITVTGDVNLITVDRLTVANNISGASIRMERTAPAMAFAATASYNGGAPLFTDSLTYGMLLTTNDYFTEKYNEELTLDSEDTYGGTVHNVTFGQGDFISENEGIYAAGIMNIAKANMSRKFVSRAYVEVTYTDNTSAVIYSDNTSAVRSLKDVAVNIKKKADYYGTLNESQKDAVDYFASVV